MRSACRYLRRHDLGGVAVDAAQEPALYKIAGSIAGSTVVGFVVVAILQFGFGSVDGNYFLTSLSLALGVAAISLFVLGMESLFGYAGFGVGGLLMMFIANPLSGMATGWQWLPSPWVSSGSCCRSARPGRSSGRSPSSTVTASVCH